MDVSLTNFASPSFASLLLQHKTVPNMSVECVEFAAWQHASTLNGTLQTSENC